MHPHSKLNLYSDKILLQRPSHTSGGNNMIIFSCSGEFGNQPTSNGRIFDVLDNLLINHSPGKITKVYSKTMFQKPQSLVDIFS